MSESYQRGSLRKVKRASGKEVWEWRYRVRGVMKQETFSVADYPTQRKLWTHLETRVRLLNEGEAAPLPQAATMGQLMHKYIEKYLPELAKSTRDTDGSMLRVHFYPRWEQTLIADVHAEDVEDWLKGLRGVDGSALSSASKGRARRLMKQLIDRAMFWRMLPVGANPITLVKVKGSTQREKKITLLTIEQVNSLIAALPQPYNVMVLVSASLGLRVEEVVALQWDDFDWERQTVTIRRAYTHSALKEPKSEASWSELPVDESTCAALQAYRAGDSVWLFPSPVTGGCMSADTILAKKIKPVLAGLGLPKIGWHTLRHSYKSWQGSGEASLSQLKDMMRHADISTTANIYGGTPVEEMRPHIARVAKQLRIV